MIKQTQSYKESIHCLRGTATQEHPGGGRCSLTIAGTSVLHLTLWMAVLSNMYPHMLPKPLSLVQEHLSILAVDQGLANNCL